jgi:hypothetical protein
MNTCWVFTKDFWFGFRILTSFYVGELKLWLASRRHALNQFDDAAFEAFKREASERARKLDRGESLIP